MELFFACWFLLDFTDVLKCWVSQRFLLGTRSPADTRLGRIGVFTVARAFAMPVVALTRTSNAHPLQVLRVDVRG